jgi:hypothetical protein
MATYLETQKSLCRKLNISYDTIAQNDLFSLEDIKDYISGAVLQVWDLAFWRFAELSKSSTIGSTQHAQGYIACPTDIAPSSIWYLRIAGKKWGKKSLATYLKRMEDAPNNTDKMWAEYNRQFFFNRNACSIGDTMELFGKKNAPALSADTDLMPFSPDTDNSEFSGNHAIVLIAYADALASEKKKNPQQAEIERKKAFAILASLKTQLDLGKALEQDVDRPMFEVPDFFPRGSGSSGNIGTFSNT